MFKRISFTANRRSFALEVDVRESLLELLRRLGFTGTKEGCGVGECGACTVLVDGETVDSCIYLALWADGKTITSIEGIAAPDGSLSDIQQNFIDCGAVQCGFCTPGLVISATAMLNKNPSPNRQDIRRQMSGNLCRCTGYQKVVEAVEKTVSDRSAQ